MKNVFKKIGIAIMTLLVFTFSSCEELEDLLKFNFDLEGEAIYFYVEAISETGELTELGRQTYDRSLADILAEESPNADINKIKEINLTSITLEIVEGADDNNNFQNISSIKAEIEADGLDGKTVAELSSVSDVYVTKLVVPVTNGKVNVKDYFNKTNFSYAVKGVFREPTTKTLKLKVTANYSFVFGL